MLKKAFKKIKQNKVLTLAILVFLVLNFVVLYNTFSEKTSSTIWDGSIAESFGGGTGNINDPYVINDGSQLAYFFTVINGNDYLSYFNKYYIINNNIDLDGNDFSFAKANKEFSGHIDGQGYSIFNFKISKNYEDNNEFNYVFMDNLSGATVENINFRDITIEVGNGMKVKDVVEENATIEENNTVPDENTTIEENNTIEDNSTVVDTNETNETNETPVENNTIVDENTTIEENNTIEDNSTVIETNETNETIEDNSTITEENETKENNEEVNETNETEEPTAFVNKYNVRRVNN